MVSPQEAFVHTVDEAFDLILKKDEKQVAALQSSPLVKAFVPSYPSHGPAPERLPLPPTLRLLLSSGQGASIRSIVTDEYMKAIYDACTLNNRTFQSQNQYQLEMVTPLYRIFRDVIPEELKLFATIARNYIKNDDVVQYAFTQAIQRRSDFTILATAAHITLKPHLYFEMDNLEYECGEDAGSLMIKPKFDYCGEVNDDLTARTEYFRLDPGINAHHRHWHEVYMDMPGQADLPTLTEKMYRGGELFYYMHSQMLARYNFERLSVGLSTIESHSDFYRPMPEGYCNRLTAADGVKWKNSRLPNTPMKNVKINERNKVINISDLELARDRLYEAIDKGLCVVDVVENGSVIGKKWEKLNPLNPAFDSWTDQDVLMDYGIDRLGDLVWSYQPRSLNFQHYGNLHNDGHLMIAYSHDPDGCYRGSVEAGVMAANETAVRDPIFFAWHSFIDDIFQRYKATLPQYDVQTQLEFDNITIDRLDIEQCGVARGCVPVLETKWFIDRVDITEGIDPAGKEKIWYQFIHLGHDEFKYKFSIINECGWSKPGTVRIFMAPYYGANEPSFNELRRHFIELDKFVVKIDKGLNIYERSSKESTLTVPIEKLFLTKKQAHALNCDAARKGITSKDAAWCRCGWPDYLLIGKGNRDGLKCRLFMMVTDYSQDRIDYDWQNKCDRAGCELGMSYCGRRNKRYPDRKPMGFPFDRNVEDNSMCLEGFMMRTRNREQPSSRFIQNMKKIDFFVKHVGEAGRPERGPTMPHQLR